jgi:hypothetical protein
MKKRESGKPAKVALFRRPGFLVRRLHQIYVAIYFQNCERFGTTPVQSSVMQVLQAQPGMDQIALAREIGVDRTTVSSVLSDWKPAGSSSARRTPSTAETNAPFSHRPGRPCYGTCRLPSKWRIGNW